MVNITVMCLCLRRFEPSSRRSSSALYHLIEVLARILEVQARRREEAPIEIFFNMNLERCLRAMFIIIVSNNSE